MNHWVGWQDIVTRLEAALQHMRPCAADYQWMGAEEVYTDVYDRLQDCRTRAERKMRETGEKTCRRDVKFDIFRVPPRSNLTSAVAAAAARPAASVAEGEEDGEDGGKEDHETSAAAEAAEARAHAALGQGFGQRYRDVARDLYFSDEDSDDSSGDDPGGPPIHGTYRWYEQQESRSRRRALPKQPIAPEQGVETPSRNLSRNLYADGDEDIEVPSDFSL